MGAIPLSFIIGSPISGWLLGVHWYGVSGWRWLFILEGLPAVIFGIVTWFYLTDWPRDADWLPENEREWLSARLSEEAAAKRSIRSYTVWQAFRDPRVLLLTFAYFLHAAIAYSFVFWLPTILKRLTGLPDFRVTLVVSLIYFASLIAMQANGWHSDHVREHRWHTAVPTLLCSACLLLILAFHPGIWLTRWYSSGIANACLLAFVTSFWAIPSAFLGESAGAASTGLINCMAMMGGFAGPYLIGVPIGSLPLVSFIFHLYDACGACGGHCSTVVRVRPLASAQ